MKEYTQKKLNDILYRFVSVESIDEINDLVSDINSTLRFIKSHMEYYDHKAVKQMFTIRMRLHNKRSKLARKRRIA